MAPLYSMYTKQFMGMLYRGHKLDFRYFALYALLVPACTCAYSTNVRHIAHK